MNIAVDISRDLCRKLQTRNRRKEAEKPDPHDTLFFNDYWHTCGNCGYKDLLSDHSQKCQTCGRAWKFVASTCVLAGSSRLADNLLVDYPSAKYLGVVSR